MSRFADFGTSPRQWLSETCNEDKRRTFLSFGEKKRRMGLDQKSMMAVARR